MYDVFEVLNWLRIRNSRDLASENVNAEPLTQMKAMKLLYYIQGAYLSKYNTRLFDSSILAWKYGPVVKKVYDKYKGKRSIVDDCTLDDINDYWRLENDKKAKDILNKIYVVLGPYSASTLMKKTHRETPWLSTPQSCEISDAKIKAYFVSQSFNNQLDKEFKKNLFEETFLENKSSMDWLKDR